MKKGLKRVAVGLAAAACMFSLAACGSSGGDKQAGGKDKLVFWHYATDRKDILDSIVKDFEKQENVDVDVQLIGGDSFDSKVQSAVQGNDLPNVWMFSGGKSMLSDFAKNGYIANLEDYAKDFDKFNELALSQVSFTKDETFETKSGIYGVPLDMNNMQILYNKEMFKDAGLDPENPPKTWDEFIAAGKKLKTAGYIPFTSGFGSWAQFQFTEQYQFSYNTPEKLDQVRKGDLTFKEGQFDKVFDLVADMRDNGLFQKGIIGLDLPAAEAAFANNQAAMLYDGSWVINVIKGLAPDFDEANYGVMAPPQAKGTTQDTLISGGVGAWLVASGKQSKEQIALSEKFMQFLTNKENQIKYANESSNIPANTEALEGDSLSPLLADFYKGMEHVQPSISGYQPSELSDTYGKVVQSIVGGDMTSEQAVTKLDQERARIK